MSSLLVKSMFSGLEGVKCDRWEMQTMADAARWPDYPCQLGLPSAVLHLGGHPIPST